MRKTRIPKKIEDSDSVLVRAVNDGKPESFEKLVERYEGKLYNFGLRMCGDPLDAEDIVQDTFLNVFKYIENFRYETKFKNWLYRIAASNCIKKRRKSKFAPAQELSLEDFIPDPPATVNVPPWASEPLERLLNEELAKTINDAILSLPENYRIVMVLRDIEGFTTEETAQITKLTPSNVKVRLHRARLYLREILKNYYDNNPT